MTDQKTLPTGFIFIRKVLMGKPTVLIMKSNAMSATDGVWAVAPGDTFEEAEAEGIRRFYRDYAEYDETQAVADE